mgnify:CR=1 FL=1
MRNVFKFIVLSTLVSICAACASATADVDELERPNAQTSKGDLEAQEVGVRDTTDTGAQPAGCIQNSGISEVRHMRITKVSIPSDASESAALGCDVSHGSNLGTGLSGLVQDLNFDLDALVSPSPNEQIPSVLIGRISGWHPQYNDTQVGQLGFELFGESDQSVNGPFQIQQPETNILALLSATYCFSSGSEAKQ